MPERICSTGTYRLYRPHTLRRLLATALLCVAVSGCMLPLPPFASDDDRHESILAYHEWLGEADAEVIETNTERYTDRYNLIGTTRDGVRLALLLSFAEDSPPEQLRRARNILEDVLAAENEEEQSSQNNQSHVRFAALWHDVLVRRLALHEALSEQSELSARLRRENEELNEQIEALKAIEQQLNQREQIQEPSL